MEEIYGVINILHIPYDVVMAMPVCERKKFIRRHNYEIEMEKEAANNNQNKVNGEASINQYAQITANNMYNQLDR